ncbi:hypothetical protein K1719_007891 [Acacia pycnantha]|nr:hypothetical protein K1719_007891 [Acacia pycnantha]
MSASQTHEHKKPMPSGGPSDYHYFLLLLHPSSVFNFLNVNPSDPGRSSSSFLTISALPPRRGLCLNRCPSDTDLPAAVLRIDVKDGQECAGETSSHTISCMFGLTGA